MPNGRRVNTVYRSISRPLTILGAERKLFFFAMCLGAATFNLLGSLLGGILMFLLLYFIARRATATGPPFPPLPATSTQLRTHYSPAKFRPAPRRRMSQLQSSPPLHAITGKRVPEL